MKNEKNGLKSGLSDLNQFATKPGSSLRMGRWTNMKTCCVSPHSSVRSGGFTVMVRFSNSNHYPRRLTQADVSIITNRIFSPWHSSVVKASVHNQSHSSPYLTQNDTCQNLARSLSHVLEGNCLRQSWEQVAYGNRNSMKLQLSWRKAVRKPDVSSLVLIEL